MLRSAILLRPIQTPKITARIITTAVATKTDVKVIIALCHRSRK